MTGAPADQGEPGCRTTVLASGPAVGPRRAGAGGWHGALGVAGELTLTLGVLVLLFVVWQVWWVSREATSASAAVVERLGREFAAAARAPVAPPTPGPGVGTLLRSEDFARGDAIGLVTVPRFGNGPQPILQGTSLDELAKGVGHDIGSVLPGQVGNFATAGHRDTYSHPYQAIDTLRPGDTAVVEVEDGWAVYVVERSRIVDPWQVEVYAPTPDEPGQAPTQAWMTLVACEPHWTAQQRWAVHARLREWVPRTPQRPSAADHPQLVAALADPEGG